MKEPVIRKCYRLFCFFEQSNKEACPYFTFILKNNLVFFVFLTNHDQILTQNYILVNDYGIKWIMNMKMSLIYSSVKKGLPLLECPYFY